MALLLNVCILQPIEILRVCFVFLGCVHVQPNVIFTGALLFNVCILQPIEIFTSALFFGCACATDRALDVCFVLGYLQPIVVLNLFKVHVLHSCS